MFQPMSEGQSLTSLLSCLKNTKITLGHNDFAVWDISPDSTLLGVTDTRINSHFAKSGLIFPQS